MRATQHISSNDVLGAPANWFADHTCGEPIPVSALAITRTKVENHDAIKCYWRPTPEEIEQLRRGALVCVTLLDNTMPPVRLTTEY